jgi:hypothetical protein
LQIVQSPWVTRQNALGRHIVAALGHTLRHPRQRRSVTAWTCLPRWGQRAKRKRVSKTAIAEAAVAQAAFTT